MPPLQRVLERRQANMTAYTCGPMLCVVRRYQHSDAF